MKLPALVVCALSALVVTTAAYGQYSLTILHSSDGESAIPSREVSGREFGGIANFVTKMNDLRTGATTDVLALSAGDNILPGNALQASIDNGVPYYDAIGLFAVGFDAAVLGNHEFDLGTGVTRDFIDSFDAVPATSSPGGFSPPAGARKPAFLSANLDFFGDTNLADIAPGGSGAQAIFSSKLFNTGSANVGVIGATTPMLPDITSPGGVNLLGTNPNDVGAAQAALDVANIINAEASDLVNNQGADSVVLLSHFQGLNFDQQVVGNLSGVDAVITGGGDELMQDAGGHGTLIPGDAPDTAETYGQMFADKDGNLVPIATTPGGYTTSASSCSTSTRPAT
jgi:5'-nucleotidase